MIPHQSHVQCNSAWICKLYYFWFSIFYFTHLARHLFHNLLKSYRQSAWFCCAHFVKVCLYKSIVTQFVYKLLFITCIYVYYIFPHWSRHTELWQHLLAQKCTASCQSVHGYFLQIHLLYISVQCISWHFSEHAILQPVSVVNKMLILSKILHSYTFWKIANYYHRNKYFDFY